MTGATRQAALTVGLTAAGCLMMAWVEAGLSPVYPVKSALKIVVFLGCAGLYTLLSGDREPFHVLRKARAVRLAAPLALGVLVCLLVFKTSVGRLRASRVGSIPTCPRQKV